MLQIQELQLTGSQTDMDHRSEVADREEQLAKLASDLHVMEERLAQSRENVSVWRISRGYNFIGGNLLVFIMTWWFEYKYKVHVHVDLWLKYSKYCVGCVYCL